MSEPESELTPRESQSNPLRQGGACVCRGISRKDRKGRLFFFFNINLFYLFILAARGLSLAASLRCAGFSLRWLLLLWSTGSRRVGFSSCGTRALERRLSSCGSRAQLLCGMWDLPRPGLEPVSPALAGGFLTTAPPGKPLERVGFQGKSRPTA